MKRVVLIGAGQLGSRHLQALVAAESASLIDVIEPNDKSLELAKTRVLAVPNRNLDHSVHYHNSLDDITSGQRMIDVCIVATGAGPRMSIVEQLAERFDVRYLLLEKVLFQSLEDYQTALDFIRRGKLINTWVNCPRRQYDIYKRVKELVSKSGPIHCTVQGGSWGLACNSIHFIDMLAFLNSATVVTVLNDGLDNELIDSKRSDHIEFTGQLQVNFSDASKLVLRSDLKNEDPVSVNIEAKNCRVCITESEGIAKFENFETGECTQVDFSLPFQSNLTTDVVNSLLSGGDCELTRLSESIDLHRPLIASLLDHYQKVAGCTGNVLPIT